YDYNNASSGDDSDRAWTYHWSPVFIPNYYQSLGHYEVQTPQLQSPNNYKPCGNSSLVQPPQSDCFYEQYYSFLQFPQNSPSKAQVKNVKSKNVIKTPVSRCLGDIERKAGHRANQSILRSKVTQ